MTAAGLTLVAFAALLFVPSIYQRRRARRRMAAARLRALRADLARVTDQRDRYLRLYHEAVRRNAALLEHIGDEREAAERALVESPIYFDTAARQTLAWLDETTWGQR